MEARGGALGQAVSERFHRPADVLEGVAAVASQVLNVLLRAISVEMKLKEQLELVERLESLEEDLEQSRGGGSRWRA